MSTASGTTRLADLTTLRVGGPAREVVTATTREELVATARAAWEEDADLFILGGGSNVVVPKQRATKATVLKAVKSRPE